MELLRRLRTEESGLTLTELMVSVMLLTVVGIIFSQVLITSMRATTDIEGATRTNDEIRLVLERIDRELRGAQEICEPRPGDQSDRLSFITRTSTDPAAGARHIVYELHDLDGDFDFTDFMRSDDGGVTFSRVVENVVNNRMAIQLGTPQLMYENQGRNELNNVGADVASPSYGKVISLTVWVDSDPNDRIGPKVETTEVAGRNVWTPNAAQCT